MTAREVSTILPKGGSTEVLFRRRPLVSLATCCECITGDHVKEQSVAHLRQKKADAKLGPHYAWFPPDEPIFSQAADCSRCRNPTQSRLPGGFTRQTDDNLWSSRSLLKRSAANVLSPWEGFSASCLSRPRHHASSEVRKIATRAFTGSLEAVSHFDTAP